jgi:transcriptional regulator NrdR family protein
MDAKGTMTTAKDRPYLTDRSCGKCLVRFETSERREGGWLYVTFRCPGCGHKSVVTFSPQELAEWESRRRRS